MAQSTREEIMVFGPQCLSLNEEVGQWLRNQLFEDPDLHWALESLRSLRSHAHELSSVIPILNHLDLDVTLQSLSEWLQTGSDHERTLHWPLSNTLLTPLTVMLHLIQFLQKDGPPTSNQSIPKPADCCTSLNLPNRVPGILGLCTGSLSAAVVSRSDHQEQLETHGSVVLRLAMLIGAIVDATDLSFKEPERAFSCSVSWTQSNGYDALKEILRNFPSAYVSVIQDERKVTVTGVQATSNALLSQLKGSSFTAIEISLQGFFHWKGHIASLNSAIALCASNPEFQLESSSKIDTCKHTSSSKSSEMLLRAILVEQADWYDVFSNAISKDGVHVTCFGTERCVPTYVKKDFLVANPVQGTRKLKLGALGTPEDSRNMVDCYQNHVAIVGMGCHLPGATDMTEFWELLCSARSQHTEVPPERFALDTPWRKASERKSYGNFVQDHDVFDARFFKKSPREAASIDPQQRLMLQVAYQAVQQSGYFIGPRDKNVGCYIAFGLSDYEGNIACHPANAYTATGNLKAFSAGRISHYFGWTGPGLTIDTACSSSAVALHLACQSILHGECSAALVGGVNIMAGPDWFHNLGAASFLSPTGQCKPFDASADGYCRGEAVGAVFLKDFTAALRDGDQIFGTIAASRVQQNTNTTAITVPNAPSLGDLFGRVLEQSRMNPTDITYVEAHGTGTPVGDPIEYDGVRRVLGGLVRTHENRLSVGAVKGLLGHAESASGIVALLKLITMLHFERIPPQASFNKINPMLNATSADHMDIPTVCQPWDAEFKAAMINNYGASGSNAALVVVQPPYSTQAKGHALLLSSKVDKTLPFAIHALDELALRRNTAKLAAFVRANPKMALRDISFAFSRQCNRELPMMLSFSCENTDQMLQNLDACDPIKTTSASPPRPVILCFGGQSSQSVGLDRQIYQDTAIFRLHLDQCDAVCRDLGLSIYPAIFQTTEILDPVHLHAALFSIQYASARSWLDCMPGIKVAGVVGHSFGELTALCIAGAVSLEDMLRFITGRAQLIAEWCGAEKGSMLAVEGDMDIVQALLAESAQIHQSDHPASIACYNSPMRFTIAGSDDSVKAFIKAARARLPPTLVKIQDLDVNYAYHCSLADPILPALRELASQIEFRETQIHIEHACARPESLERGSDMLVNHLRQPVYFYQAVQRLAARHKSAIWLEAGSNSGVTVLANLTVDSIKSENLRLNHCQSVSLRDACSSKALSAATLALWQNGINVTFWQHHKIETNEYHRILMPPYQFEKARHWLDRKEPPHVDSVNQQSTPVPETLWSFLGFLDDQGRSARFRVNTDSHRYRTIVDGHIVAKAQALCPSTLQLDIVIEALMSLQSSFSDGTHLPRMLDMVNHAPLVSSITDTVQINARAVGDDKLVWEWSISTDEGVGATQTTVTIYAAGKIEFCRANAPETIKLFSQYERLVRRERVFHLLSDHSIDAIQGQKHIYKLFSEYVEYSPMFRGLQRLVAKGEQESAATVSLAGTPASWHDFAMTDSFCQVAGVFINVMTERSIDEMFISDRIDQVLQSPNQSNVTKSPGMLFDIYACHQQPSGQEFVSDVFVFDSGTGVLVEVILGIHYRKVSRTGLGRALIRMTSPAPTALHKAAGTSQYIELPQISYETESKSAHASHQEPSTLSSVNEGQIATRARIASQVRIVIADLSGLDSTQIVDGSDLVDLGIDSLMGMELVREINSTFGCSVDISDLLELSDVASLITLVRSSLGQSLKCMSEAGDVPSTASDSSELQTPQQSPSQPEPSVLAYDLSPDLQPEMILEHFRKCSESSDQYVMDVGLNGYSQSFLTQSDALCISYICDAFEQLGCQVRSAPAGQILEPIEYSPRHSKFVALLYELLERSVGLIVRNESGVMLRTDAPLPTHLGQALLDARKYCPPEFSSIHGLTELVGSKLAECLIGKADGIQLIFGTPEGRDLASKMYATSPINTAWLAQLEDFLRGLLPQLAKAEPIRILEMGAGTGGTSCRLIPLLAELGVPVRYTISDISASLVAAARKRFKVYSFVDYRVLDIEADPPADLSQTYHAVIATNCVHATKSLTRSTQNIRYVLRPDGFLLMLEMTEPLLWVDLVFGPLDGWWIFNDGRRHALASPQIWDQALLEAGYGKVQWTSGILPESRYQRLILAMASGPRQDEYLDGVTQHLGLNDIARQQHVLGCGVGITKPSDRVEPSAHFDGISSERRNGVVLVTGASGSLGAHIIQYLTCLEQVEMVVCLNRNSSAEAGSRQCSALTSRGINLPGKSLQKLRVLQANTYEPFLGLPRQDYEFLTRSVTHIIHNAWPMSISRHIDAFKMQFKIMENLLQLVTDAHKHQRISVGFQFISSIGVVGLHPLLTGSPVIPEMSVATNSALPNGYSQAKLVCEAMLDTAVKKTPEAFHSAMSVRIGQIAGSRSTGYWNPTEHFSFLVQMSQKIAAFPDLRGSLSWLPVDEVASVLGELLLSSSAATNGTDADTSKATIYHLENPQRQAWHDMVQWLASAINVDRIVPLQEWISIVKEKRVVANGRQDSAALTLIEFLEDHFERMSCGGIILDTQQAQTVSPTLREARPVGTQVMESYVRFWKEVGFLEV